MPKYSINNIINIYDNINNELAQCESLKDEPFSPGRNDLNPLERSYATAETRIMTRECSVRS